MAMQVTGIRLVASVTAVAFALSACMSAQTPSSPSDVRLGAAETTAPVHEVALPSWAGPGGDEAPADGYLGGSREVDGGCVWLSDRPGGQPGSAYVWPEGFRARFDPVVLIGPSGEVVAQEGDFVVMAGGSLAVSAVEIDRCTFGADRVFRVKYRSVRSSDSP